MIYHGDSGLADLGTTVRRAAKDIGPHKHKFDFIAVTGMSGALIGAPVAVQLGIPLVVLRKDGDTSHSYKPLINDGAAYGRYLFLDDFISLGFTFRRVMRTMAAYESRPEYAGTYLYSSRTLSWDGDGIICFTELDDDARWNVYLGRDV